MARSPAASAALVVFGLTAALLPRTVASQRYTCLFPVIGGQPLNESEIWRSISRTVVGEGALPSHGAGSSAQHSLPKEMQILLGFTDTSVAEECSSGALNRPFKEAASLADDLAENMERKGRRLAGLKELAHFDGKVKDMKLGDLARKAAKKVQPAAGDGGFDDVDDDEGAGEPVLHEGEDCLEACGGAGECRTGFCGGGRCCRRFVFDEGCPIGLHGGCEDGHCCLPRPKMAAQSSGPLRCSAKPGSFCMVSLMSDLQGRNMTLSERCILERSTTDCPPGFFCPGGEMSPVACSKGRLCEAGAKEERPCPAGRFCQVSLTSEPCPTARVCNENSVGPEICPAGFYCLNGFNVTCPEGHVCIEGSIAPKRCGFLARCPAGSKVQDWRVLSAIVCSTFLVMWLAMMRTVHRYVRRTGSVFDTLPVMIGAAFLAGAWALNLDFLHHLVWAFGLDDDRAALFSIRRLLGFKPHFTGLVFLTLICLTIVYGLTVSPDIAERKVRNRFDLILLVAGCLNFCMFLQEWLSVMFIFNIVIALKVVWMLITQEGSFRLRATALGSALLFLVLGFLAFGAAPLAQLLLGAIAAATAREVVQDKVNQCLANRARRLEESPDDVLERRSRSIFSDLPSLEQSWIDCLIRGQPRSPVAAAAAAISAARASLQMACVPPTGAAMVAGAEMGPTSAWVPRYDRSVGDSDDDHDHDAGILDEQHFGAGGASSSSSAPAPGAGGLSAGRRQSGVCFELRNLTMRLDNGKTLLHDLTFTVPAGASAAVMGASGAGKTTLLSALSGRVGERCLSGQLAMNGVVMTPRLMSKMRPLSGYVPQDDVLHSSLTVRENIEFQAELRLRHAMKGSRDVTDRHIQHRISNVLEGMGISHVADRLVSSGLSGGQRKRVSIGMEVVCRPRVLMLDEPSSGLDASTSHRIIENVLQGTGKERCTTFASIHQPRWSTLSLFDMLVLLAPGGHLVYAGPIAGVKAYFIAVPKVPFTLDQNPADVFIDATAFDSARSMVLEGVWKAPPQCLRSILIPAPEMDLEDGGEERKDPWKMEEFGTLLGAMWRSFANITKTDHALVVPQTPSSAGDGDESPPSSSDGLASGAGAGGARELQVLRGPTAARTSAPACSSLAKLEAEAEERIQDMHWAKQIWMQLARALLITSRTIWPHLLMNHFLTVLAVGAVAWAFPILDKFMCETLAVLCALLCLVQGVCSQRVFGGEERKMAHREGGILSQAQVMFSFVGKDVASFAEIAFGAACFTAVYWNLIASTASGSDFFAFAFTLYYSVWGANHIWAICFPTTTAYLMAIIFGFMTFTFAGVFPQAQVLTKAMGGYGSLLLLGSPGHWAISSLTYWHVTGVGSNLLQREMKGSHIRLQMFGFDLKHLPTSCPDSSSTVLERWKSNNHWSCHTGQLLLLGVLFRFVAAVCLLVLSSKQASGGELAFGTSSALMARLLRNLIVIFVTFFVLFEVLLLGHMS